MPEPTHTAEYERALAVAKKGRCVRLNEDECYFSSFGKHVECVLAALTAAGFSVVPPSTGVTMPDAYRDWAGVAVVCGGCGAVVSDVSAHDAFHRRVRASEPPLMAFFDPTTLAAPIDGSGATDA